jgi:hypothetical protein
MNPATTNETNATHEPTIAPTHTKMSPVDWWSGLSDFFGITAAIVGGILAVITLLGWGFSWKAGKLKDAALETFKSESNVRISEAQTKAAEANRAAADANERAAALRKEAEIAHLELEKLKARQADRFLSPIDSDILVSLVKSRKGAKISIVSIMGDLEAIRYANQFKSAFVAAGWNVSGVEQKIDSSGMAFGLIVCVKDLANPPPQALFIRDTLVSMGFSVGYNANEEVPDDTPWIVAGSKQATIKPPSK